MANLPCFFKIILEDVIQAGKLGIPNKFVRRYGNYLQEHVFLKVPSGAKWKVELVKNSDNIWLGNGWQHFVDYYSLSLGSFLVFGFEDFESCTFNVLIFDKTASEIDYPFHVHQDNEQPNLDEQFHQPINQEDEDKSPSPFSRPRKKRKQEKCTTQSQAKELLNDNALHKASSSCKSDNPSFSIVMRPSYICVKHKVTIPASFAKKYFREQKGIIFLSSVDGKTWSVEYSSYRVNSRNRILTTISCGWKKFAEENHLEIGDVCIFQLIDHNASKLEVVIRKSISQVIDYPFHVHQDDEEPNLEEQINQPINEGHIDVDALPPPFSRPRKKRKQENCTTQSEARRVNRDVFSKKLTPEEKANALERASCTFCNPDIPSFSIVMQPSYISTKKAVTIPASFANKYITKQQGILTLNSIDGKTWSVGYASYRICKTSRVTIISNGWRKFVEDNHLEVRDVCVFELINNHNASNFKVVISRGNHEASNSIPSI